MSGDADDPARAPQPDPDAILVWNGLVTRMQRSPGENQDGEAASTTIAGRDRAPGTAPKTGEQRGDEPSPG